MSSCLSVGTYLNTIPIIWNQFSWNEFVVFSGILHRARNLETEKSGFSRENLVCPKMGKKDLKWSFFSFYRNLVSLFLELILNERHQNSLFFQANTKSWKILVYKLYMEILIIL